MLPRLLVAGTLAIVLGAATLSRAGVPTEKIRDTSNKIIAIVTDQSLKAPGKETERAAKVRAAVDERFEWSEMAKRSLGRYWAQRTPEEQKDFTKLFSDLIERTYMEKVEGYEGQPITYLSESTEDGFAVVKVSVATDNQGGSPIPVEYRLLNKDSDWRIYDVVVEGVSLVNNYRTQFSEILGSSSYPKLVERIKAKMREMPAK